MKDAMRDQFEGNISVMMIAFQSLEDYFKNDDFPRIVGESLNNPLKKSVLSLKLSQVSLSKAI
jgi:hypothetical protein